MSTFSVGNQTIYNGPPRFMIDFLTPYAVSVIMHASKKSGQ